MEWSWSSQNSYLSLSRYKSNSEGGTIADVFLFQVGVEDHMYSREVKDEVWEYYGSIEECLASCNKWRVRFGMKPYDLEDIKHRMALLTLGI